ncbi:hypothetical protein Peur_028139 [Populus x canadensis]
MPGTRLRACRARGKSRKQLIKLLVLICLDDESLLENRVSPLHAFLKDRAHHDLILDVCIFSLYFYASILYFLF